MRGEQGGGTEADGGKVKEADIQRQILDYLKRRHIWHRRFNSGIARTGGRFVRFGTPGLPDILARPGKTLVWIEVKQPGKYLTPEQRAWKHECEAFGDIFITARSVDDVMQLFEPRRG